MLLLEWTAAPCFNPRAPEGARRNMGVARMALTEFQSTRPRRGATPSSVQPQPILTCFNPRAPEGARLCVRLDGSQGIHVSIHAPPKGRDCMEFEELHVIIEFQSTRPRRGATARLMLLAGHRLFQSTRPRRGAMWSISNSTLILARRFQSTRPRRGAIRVLAREEGEVISRLVSIHAPPEGRDLAEGGQYRLISLILVSIHAPPEGRDQTGLSTHNSQRHKCFNPRAPGGAR